MIALAVIVLHERRDSPAQMTLAERNDSVEALVLDRAHEPFGIGIRTWRVKRGVHNANSGSAQPGHAPAR